MNRVAKFILDFFRTNLLLKFMALLFAFIIWGYVITGTNPVREKAVHDVPVSFINSIQLEENNLIVLGNLREMLSNVDVIVSAEQKNHNSIDPNAITADVDLGLINGAGQIELNINVSTRYGTVVSVKPSTITLDVEEISRKPVPIEPVLTGQVRDGYYILPPEISPEEVEIIGPRSYVEKVKKAVCYIPTSSLTQSVKENYEITLLDKNTNTVDSSYFKGMLPSTIVDLKVYKINSVPIDTESIVTGEVAEGYKITDIKLSQNNLDVAAPDEVLENITKVTLKNIDVKGAKQSITQTLDINPIDNAIFVNGETVDVTVVIEEIQETVTFDNIAIEVKNTKLGATASPAKVSVEITGYKSVVSSLKSRDIKLYVDLKDKPKGTHKVKIDFDVIEGATILPDTLYAQVTLR